MNAIRNNWAKVANKEVRLSLWLLYIMTTA
jgi:hypothetical protein